MSIPVELYSLAEAMAKYRFAYLLSAGAQGAPHAVAVTPTLEGGALVLAGIGRRSRDNMLTRSAVSLVWPPQFEDGYSLIVDGQADVAALADADSPALRIVPTRAVLHRPTPRPELAVPGACGSDCVELLLPSAALR
ncbi:MAG: hypothetical protein WCY32_01030 [Burkholderiaceae bacterium]